MKEETRVKSYFKNRGVDSGEFEGFRIPVYLRKILPENKEARILDIGCGFGQILAELRKMGYKNISGADRSDESVGHCTGIGLDVKKIGDVQELFDDGQKYDFVIMTHVIEHIEKNRIIETLRNIKILLAEGGGLYLTTPNAQANTGSYWMFEDFTHTTIFTGGSLLYVLKAAGFSDIAFIDSEDMERHGPGARFLKKILLGLYKLNKKFWNKVTASAYHKQSPEIYAFELKVLARK